MALINDAAFKDDFRKVGQDVTMGFEPAGSPSNPTEHASSENMELAGAEARVEDDDLEDDEEDEDEDEDDDEDELEDDDVEDEADPDDDEFEDDKDEDVDDEEDEEDEEDLENDDSEPITTRKK
jgi:hypothetical protein